MARSSTTKATKLPQPSRFLLADEHWEDEQYRLELMVQDLKPANMLEYRQVELIVRCDIDIDRQYRLMAHHLNPLGDAESKAAEAIAEWMKFSLMHPNQVDEFYENEPAEAAGAVQLEGGDARLTPLVANRYAARRNLMEIHQREINAAYRRRRQEVALLNELQDRRRARVVPDAEVIEEA